MSQCELPDDATDEQIQEAACVTHGCLNYRAQGYIICETCLHGSATKLPLKHAKRKFQMERRPQPQQETTNA